MLKLSSLNKEQREAVEHVEGPVVVVAGAGTGKTRTIAYRAARLLEKKVPAESLLCITFTNKAAREMRERVSSIVTEETCSRMTICTIHSLCAKMLREDIGELGRDPAFGIMDSTDQAGLVKKALIEHGFDPQKYDPRALLWRIGSVKNAYPEPANEDFADPVFARVYETYNSLLLKNNSLDFDDLLLCASKLLDSKKVRTKYQERFKFIMVDEYQDVNGCQYGIIKKLASKHKNLYVVGDEDQSIYGWRGARMENILNFERDFKGARLIKLERNYRSTGTVIEASNHVIRNNSMRRDKKLWTSADSGEPITLMEAPEEGDEAAAVISMIHAEKTANRGLFGDFAILFRTNAQSRAFEEKLIGLGISYVIVGGAKFFERREIKDVTSYLKAFTNPDDDVALLRVVNFPPRGIGKTTLEKILQTAAEKRASLMKTLEESISSDAIPRKAKEGIAAFLRIKETILKHITANPQDPAGAMKRLLAEVNFEKAYSQACSDANEAARRYENIVELANAVFEYQKNDSDPSIQGFLENIALMTDEAETEEELKQDSVALMTLHSAKGLEFKTVFIVGVEEGYIPHERSEAEGGLEEERRLFYVGMTRARKRLFLSYALSRRRFGETIPRKPSRFIEEIPVHLTVRGSEEEIRIAREQASRAIATSALDKISSLFGD
ncbi:MAG TPA: 3'-5' exonuclease [bacterium]|nr:3'-5' exonuclease [bacterium]